MNIRLIILSLNQIQMKWLGSRGKRYSLKRDLLSFSQLLRAQHLPVHVPQMKKKILIVDALFKLQCFHLFSFVLPLPNYIPIYNTVHVFPYSLHSTMIRIQIFINHFFSSGIQLQTGGRGKGLIADCGVLLDKVMMNFMSG